MNKLKILCCFTLFVLVLSALSSVAFGADLSQSEVDAIIKGVENGDAEAQFRLGMMYCNGQNVKKDYEQAVYWFKKSYEQGNVEAQFWLAVMYREGNDEAQSFNLFKQVAEKDPSTIKKVYGFEENGAKVYSSAEELVAVAQFMIGRLYFDGEGTERDYKQAEYWFKKASEHGSEEAKKQAEKLFAELRTFQDPKAEYQKSLERSISENVMEINIQQAFKECRDNGLVYKRKYDGKKVRVTEKIFYVDTAPITNKIFVRLSYKNHDFDGGIDDLDDLYCYFEDSEADSVMKLKAGQKVTIEGTCEESALIPFRLAKCHIIAVNNSNNATKEPEHSIPQNQAPVSTYTETPKTGTDDTQSWLESLEYEIDEATIEFVKRERIPKSIVSSGEIDVLRSYTSQFKAIRGDGAIIFSEPNTNSEVILKLDNGAKLIADAEYTNDYGGDWYYVHFQDKAKCWVLAEYLVEREPDEDTHNNTTNKNNLGLVAADVIGNKVNVRRSPTKGKVLFQVSNTNDDCLIVEEIPINDNGNDWYKVRYQYKDEGGDSWYEEAEGFIIGRFIQLRPLSDIELMLIGSGD